MKPNSIFYILTLSLILNGYLAKTIYSKNKNEALAAMQTRENMLLMYRNLPVDTADVVFIGSSITRWFPVTELSKNGCVRNRGISGDNIPGVMGRIQPIATAKPKKIFIEIGINDLRTIYRPHIVPKKSINDNLEIANLLNAYSRLLDTIQLLSRNKTAIYVQSLFPVNKMMGKNAEKINHIIPIINTRLKALAIAKGCTYVDNYKPFTDAGNATSLNSKYSDDGLHLNIYGWQLWYACIKRYI